MSALAAEHAATNPVVDWGFCSFCDGLTSRRASPFGGGPFQCDDCFEQDRAESHARMQARLAEIKAEIEAENRKQEIERLSRLVAFTLEHPWPKGLGCLQRMLYARALERGFNNETFTLGCDEMAAVFAAQGVHAHPSNICHAARSLECHHGVLEHAGQLVARDAWGFQGPGETINPTTGEIRVPGATGAIIWRLVSKTRATLRISPVEAIPACARSRGSSSSCSTYGVNHAGGKTLQHRAEKLLEKALARARIGNRDVTCFVMGRILKSIGVDQDQAERLGVKYAEQVPQHPDHEPFTRKGGVKCIRSAYRRTRG